VSLSTHLAGGWVIATSFWIWEREGPDAHHGNEPLFIQPTSVVDHQQTWNLKFSQQWLLRL